MQLVVPRRSDGTASVDGRSPRLGGVTGWLRRRGLIPNDGDPGIAPPAPAAATETATGTAAETAIETAIETVAGTTAGTADAAVQPLSDSLERTRVLVRGTVGDVTVRTRSGWPRLEAELSDGTATVVLVWLGRRRLAGVEPGGTLAAGGMLVRRGSRRVIFNPSYELLP